MIDEVMSEEQITDLLNTLGDLKHRTKILEERLSKSKLTDQEKRRAFFLVHDITHINDQFIKWVMFLAASLKEYPALQDFMTDNKDIAE